METRVSDSMSAQSNDGDIPQIGICWECYQVFYDTLQDGLERSKSRYFNVDKMGWQKVLCFIKFLRSDSESFCLKCVIKVGKEVKTAQEVYSLWDPDSQEFSKTLYVSSLEA